METARGREPRDPDELFDIDAGAAASLARVAGSAPPAVAGDGAAAGGGPDERPHEPAPAETPAPGADAVTAALSALRDLGGAAVRGLPDGPASHTMLPALLHPYRDLSRVRHAYPVCVSLDADAPGARPLADVLDEAIAAAAGEGDEGERLRRHVLRLEAAVRTLCEESPGAPLSTLWDRAAADLVGAEPNDERGEALRSNLAAARRALPFDGTLHPCDAGAARRLFEAATAADRRRRAEAFRTDLIDLIVRVEAVLRADFERTPEAHDPDHLSVSAGSDTDAVDFSKMAEILDGSRHDEPPMPADRRRRIEDALETLRRFRPLFDPADDAPPPFPMDPIEGDVDAALAAARHRVEETARFVRAVRVAQLEVENRYRPERHDAVFAAFGPDNLDEAERALVPPVELILDDDALAGTDLATLGALAAGAAPVKVLVDARTPGPAVEVPAALATLGTCFTARATIALPEFLTEAFTRGAAFAGPAVLCVYTPRPADGAPPVYLIAAAAHESRAVPAFVYDPAAGPTWADRMDVSANPSPEADWSTDTFAWLDPDGEERTETVALTPADVLACDPDAADGFRAVPREAWVDAMVPLETFLDLPADEAAGRVPYVRMVDPEGRIWRVAVGRPVLDAVRRTRDAWRRLRELGGVRNSFVERTIEAVRARIEEEKRREVEEIERRYASDFEKDLGVLTQEIVGRIAAQLVSGAAGAPAPVVPTGAPPAASPPAPDGGGAAAGASDGAPAAPAAEADDEDEALSFDDPYIDTPLCTSCNECTKQNAQLFAYDDNKQAYIRDPSAGTFRDLVVAAEKCPVKIIHPGKPKNPDEPGLDDLVRRAEPFNG